jgi:hypothetical protein
MVRKKFEIKNFSNIKKEIIKLTKKKLNKASKIFSFISFYISNSKFTYVTTIKKNIYTVYEERQLI